MSDDNESLTLLGGLSTLIEEYPGAFQDPEDVTEEAEVKVDDDLMPIFAEEVKPEPTQGCRGGSCDV